MQPENVTLGKFKNHTVIFQDKNEGFSIAYGIWNNEKN